MMIPRACRNILLLLWIGQQPSATKLGGFAKAFSTPPPPDSSSTSSSSFSLFDRFRPECPANPQSIAQYDPGLLSSQEDDGDNDIWVAVFRTSNNAPSVFVKDEFFNAMRLATGGITETPTGSTAGQGFAPLNDQIETKATKATKNEGNDDDQPLMTSGSTTPVAVARLCPSVDFPGCYTLDNMRCSLKKENTDDTCEGGSEHKEALSVAMDALLMHYLSDKAGDNDNDNQQQPPYFEGAIRSKATLVGASLLEERGFQEVTSLSKDMATHISSLDSCMEKYAEKYVESMTTKNQGARDRAERILSLLGRLDRDADYKAAKAAAAEQEGNGDGDEDEYDPWASMKQLL